MSTVDLTKYFPSWTEPDGEAYLITEDPEDPGPGSVIAKKYEPTLIRIKSGQGEPIRLSLRLELTNGNWNMALSWASKMFNCPRMTHELGENSLILHGDIMHAGNRTPGTMRFVLAEDGKTTRIEFDAGFSFLNRVFWTFQEDEPDWDDDDDFDDYED